VNLKGCPDRDRDRGEMWTKGGEETGKEYRSKNGQVECGDRTTVDNSLYSRRYTTQPDAEPEGDFSKVIWMTTP